MNLIAVRFLGVLLLLQAPASWAAAGDDDGRQPSAPMNERILIVLGDPARPVTLQVTLLTPDAGGPFPLAVMNHGAAGSANAALMPRYRTTFSAFYFLSRGYAVVLPMMRGHAGSGGKVDLRGCDLKAVGLANAKDIQAVMERVAALPYIDGRNIVMAGQSYGGWNTLAFGTLNHPRVKGLINFVGGMSSAQCPGWEATLPRDASYFGARTKVPSIWFYGDNDSLFPPPIWHAMYDSYVAAGGQARLVDIGSFMSDSHKILGFPEGLRLWAGKVDAFLDKLGMPNKVLYPQYLPVEFPPPSHYAALDDLDAVPYIGNSVEARQAYRRFLEAAMPRVFIVAPSGYAGSDNGGFDPIGRGLARCSTHAKRCAVYAADDYVAWSRPTPAPPPTRFAALTDPQALPYVNESGRQGYLKFLAMGRPRAFVIAPDGAWSASRGGEDPISAAMQSCAKAHQGCRLYATDGDVVWPER